MKQLILYFVVLLSLSSCIVEIELDPPIVHVGAIEEYETKEVIHEVWSDGVLIYEEAIYRAQLEIEFLNVGGVRANNVWAEVIFYDGHKQIERISIYLPDLRSGSTYIYTLDTGFESIYDYSDYEVNVYWE